MTNSVDEVITQTSVSGLVCVTMDVHLWSGRKRLKKEALIAKNPEFAKLPPESLATLGSIKVCDTDDLAPFLRLKREAEKLLNVEGLPVLGSRGIPDVKLNDVYRNLVRIKTTFDKKASDFEKRYVAAIDEWRKKDENKDWTQLISDIPSAAEVAGKLSFGFHLSRASPPSSDEFSEVNANYANQMTGLKGELFADAEREAQHLIANYLIGKGADGVVKHREKVTWKTLRPLKRIGEKLKSFAFLDPTVEPLAEMIEHVLKLLPVNGPIDGVYLMHIWTLAKTLSNKTQAMEVAAVAFSAESSADAFEHALALQKPYLPDIQVQPPVVERVPVATEQRIAPNVPKERSTNGLFEETPMPIVGASQPQFIGLF